VLNPSAKNAFQSRSRKEQLKRRRNRRKRRARKIRRRKTSFLKWLSNSRFRILINLREV
jgi:hypothetical protein